MTALGPLSPAIGAAERYEPLHVLGRGGMGEVVAARDRETGAMVALKRIQRGLLSEALTARLLREALAARRVESAFVPKLYGVHTDDHEVVLVLEFLPGHTLEHWLTARVNTDESGNNSLRTFAWEELRALAQDLLRGLVDAHTAGVIHRDLKPANIMLVPGRSEPFSDPLLPPSAKHDRAMILDFGVCKVEGDGGRLTQGGDTLGTIAYMAPEQIRGSRDVDERADLYALATVLYECVAGDLPFATAGGDLALVARKLEGDARPLGPCAQIAVPIGFDAFLAKALARRPSARFSSAQEMLRAFRALGPPTVLPSALPATDAAGSDASSGRRSGTAHTTDADGLSDARRASTSDRRSSRLGVALAVATLGGVAVLLALVALRDRVAAKTDKKADESAPFASVQSASMQPASMQSAYMPSALAETVQSAVIDPAPSSGAPQNVAPEVPPKTAPRTNDPAPRGVQFTRQPRY